MKKCSKCGLEKDESEFSSNKNTKDKLYIWCRDCKNKNVKKWSEKNQEKLKNSRLFYKYKLTSAQYNEILLKQTLRNGAIYLETNNVI
jgi:hypothetical protein